MYITNDQGYYFEKQPGQVNGKDVPVLGTKIALIYIFIILFLVGIVCLVLEKVFKYSVQKAEQAEEILHTCIDVFDLIISRRNHVQKILIKGNRYR